MSDRQSEKRLIRCRLRWRRMLRYFVQRIVLRSLVSIYTRTTLDGRVNLAGVRGPFVLVANHCSHLDTAVIVAKMPYSIVRHLAVGAAADHFFNKNKRVGKLATSVSFNAYPIHRQSGGDKAEKGLSRRLLTSGVPVLIYPEGTRSRTGELGTFRPGVAALCVDMGVPCIPVALRGTAEAMPVGRSWPVAGRPVVQMRIGSPLRPMPDEDAIAFNTRMMAAVSTLQGQGRPVGRPVKRAPVHGIACAANYLEVS
jgi:1-acyl-sn-glycerol-3-phosphate acyltransferase